MTPNLTSPGSYSFLLCHLLLITLFPSSLISLCRPQWLRDYWSSQLALLQGFSSLRTLQTSPISGALLNNRSGYLPPLHQHQKRKTNERHGNSSDPSTYPPNSSDLIPSFHLYSLPSPHSPPASILSLSHSNYPIHRFWPAPLVYIHCNQYISLSEYFHGHVKLQYKYTTT